jgi:DNA-binding transcriptional LysR family regulator
MKPTSNAGVAQDAAGLLKRLMDLRHLRNFLAVVEAGGISSAARKLHLTQSALSRQVKGLEELLGVELLRRDAHSVTPTAAGELLATEGRKLMQTADSMLERVLRAGNHCALRVGYAPSLAGDFLPVAIQRFSQLHPGVRVSLADLSSAEMLVDLSNDKLDVIVAPFSAVDSLEILCTKLCCYEWRLVVPASHALAKQRIVRLGDLQDRRLLLFDRSQYPDYWERVTGFFRKHGLQAKIAGEYDGVASLSAAIEGNLGIAMLAESSAGDGVNRGRLVALPLEQSPEAIIVAAGISSLRDPSPMLLAFVEELRLAATRR